MPHLDDTPILSIVILHIRVSGVGVNDIEYVALVETTREELRQRIADAWLRFDEVVRAADPRALPPATTGPLVRSLHTC